MTLGANQIAAAKTDAIDRYVRPLIPFRDARGYLVDRALVSCGRRFGLGRRRMRGLVQSVYRIDGNPRLAKLFPLNDRVPDPRDLPEEDGFVYLARCCDFPHIVKIGWTGNPERREIELCREAGAVVEIEFVRNGNLADETLDMLARRADHLTVEWFVDRSKPFDGLPPFMAKIEPDQGVWGVAIDHVKRAADAGRDFQISAHSTLYYFQIKRAEAA